MPATRATVTATTTSQTIRLGDEVRRGRLGGYHWLAFGPGEPHLRRDDLRRSIGSTGGGPIQGDAVPEHPSPTADRRLRVIAHLVQLSDFHLVDVASPARIEFAESHAEDPAFAQLVPAQRPHEAFVRPALAALVETISALGGTPRSSTAPELAIATGDMLDNAQENELAWYLAILDGGTVGPLWPSEREGVYGDHWPTRRAYWSPEYRADRAKIDWGFPHLPGVLEKTSFVAGGLGIPWLACQGNHEVLVQGVLPATAELDELARGATKVFGLPERLPAGDLFDALLADPSAFFTGPSRAVRPDASRRLLAAGDFVAAHLRPGAKPAGHGFTEANLARGDAYYVFDGRQGIRIVVLDTAHPGGAAAGSIGEAQFAWLEERLAEVHTRFLDRTGRPMKGRMTEDRTVVIASHHGPGSLTNQLPCPTDEVRFGGPDVVTLLHRFPNVVGWLSGHTHRHSITAYPHRRTGGFWAITTGSVMDWPCQARQIEIIENPDRTLSIWSTMVDHGAPLDPRVDHAGPAELTQLAAIHREMAANRARATVHDPYRGMPSDRNVELVVPQPGLR